VGEDFRTGQPVAQLFGKSRQVPERYHPRGTITPGRRFTLT
jgi:hypothetical protein